MARWAAVLAGGSGTRFWPLSSPDRPKQLLPLAADRVLLQQAVDRLSGVVEPDHIFVITAERLAATTRALLPALPAANVLAEPRPASTGPALVWGTQVAASRDPDATILALHADWFVGDDALFRATARQAMDAAERHDRLITVGVVPTRPDTSYGYVRPGAPLDGDVRQVEAFVEKPDAARAAKLMAQGALWNSGLFAWTARRFDTETTAHAPEIAPHRPLLAAGNVAGFFAAVTPIAVDVSHFERSKRVAVLPGRFPWDDVGTWSALARVRATDGSGNVLVGRTFQHESARCVAWADDGAIVLDGVEGLVVVRAHGVTLVTTVARAEHLKELLAAMPAQLRTPTS